jgi:YVTN family beta-propeller protein
MALRRRLLPAVLVLLCAGAGMSVAEAQPRADVADECDNTVSVIETASNAVTGTLTGFSCPGGIAFTPEPVVPQSKDDCKDGGWRTYGAPAGPFRNQGACVSYVENKSRNRP